MATSPYHIASLLDKMSSSDKDFRYMATNDLMSELQKDSIKLDDDRERLVVQSLLRLLEDKNGEVQNLAVKCLGPLVKKVKEHQVEWIVDTLCTNMTNMTNKEQLRDISSIGLKTVISELPSASSPLSSTICKRITGRLTEAITKTDDQSVQLESLDILADLLGHFGGLLISFHPSIMKCILPLLVSPRMAIRKRTILALSHLVMTANTTLFVELMNHLICELNERKNHLDIRTFIQCIGGICRQSGRRVGEYLDKVIPIIVSYSKIENDDELRETCVQTLESFVCKCPKEITQYIGQIIDLCLEFLCYDPNYNYGDDDDDDNSMDVNGDMDEDDIDDDGEEYSDDDDMSWKVRRAAAKCLASILASRHDLIKEFYSDISPKLIARFKEREENVKSDIFGAYVALLRQTRPIMSSDTDEDASDSPVAMLRLQVPAIISAMHKQMQEKSVKTRLGCFNLLTELVNVLPGALSDHIQLVVPGIHFSISDKLSTSNMKIDALAFLGCILHQHPPHVFLAHLDKLLPVVIAAVKDPFYKITSEALGVMQAAIKVMRPLDKPVEFDYKQYIPSMYEAVFFRLRAADIDQEVKEKSISCMGQLICNIGDSLVAELPNCLPIFLDRLRNEITRLTAVKALIMVAGSPLKINLSCILNEAVPLLATFLRKNHRGLKLSTLTCLDILIQNYGNVMTRNHFESVLNELPALISENDLHISQLALNLLTSISRHQKSLLSMIKTNILNEALVLTKSPLLQGNGLHSMIQFLNELVTSGEPGLGYNDLLSILTEVIYAPKKTEKSSLAIHKMAFYSIAKCVAELTLVCRSEVQPVVDKFIMDIKNPNSSDSVSLFSLLAIGEIGSHIDLSGKAELKNVILDAFSSESEDVKSAASYSLGHVTVGNLQMYLPFILQEIEKNAKRQYLLLHSLKEVITCQSVNTSTVETIQPFLPAIWTLLFSHCEHPEEGTRNIVAECLGKLTIIDPVNLLPLLQKNLASESPQMRSTVITAFKFTISDQPQSVDALLKDCLHKFLEPITDTDLNVRRVSLTTLNSAAHNKPRLIRDLLPDILPHLYNETKQRKELIREVEMGPFKHTVDDGLDIRKAAFECMYTLLDSCLDRLDIFQFLNHVEDGLKDHYDIKMLTYLMLVRLSSLCPNAVLQHIDRIIEPLRSTVHAKVKANSVKQEYEKQDELKRSALRAISSLLHIPDAEMNPLLSDFVTQIRSSSDLGAMFESIQQDQTTASYEGMDTS